MRPTSAPRSARQKRQSRPRSECRGGLFVAGPSAVSLGHLAWVSGSLAWELPSWPLFDPFLMKLMATLVSRPPIGLWPMRVAGTPGAQNRPGKREMPGRFTVEMASGGRNPARLELNKPRWLSYGTRGRTDRRDPRRAGRRRHPEAAFRAPPRD